jgi:C4-dicarboxylate transporter DctM subunit
MDTMVLTLLTLPIVFPVVVNFGFNPILLGILYTINAEMALITSPLGMNVFIIHGMTKDIPKYTIFRSVFPFVIALIVCTALIIIFPDIALVLPNTMMD